MMIDLPMTVTRNCPPISYSLSHLFADFSGSYMRNDSKIVFLTVPFLYIHIWWVCLGPLCVAQHDGYEHSPSGGGEDSVSIGNFTQVTLPGPGYTGKLVLSAAVNMGGNQWWEEAVTYCFPLFQVYLEKLI